MTISPPSTEPTGRRGNDSQREHDERLNRLYDAAGSEDDEETTTATAPQTRAPAAARPAPLAALFAPTKVRLKEGRFSFSIDVLFFSVNEAGGILICLDPRAASDIQFVLEEEYHFEHEGRAYPRALFMGKFTPFRDAPYQLLSFIHNPEVTQP